MATSIDDMLNKAKEKLGNAKRPRYGYVQVKPIVPHAAILDRWATRVCELPFNRVQKDDFHVTLIFDKRNKVKADPKKKIHKSRMYSAELYNLAVFEGSGALVLELDSPELSNRHRQLSGLGFKHDYPAYRPHLTLMNDNAAPRDFFSCLDSFSELFEELPHGLLFTSETWEPVKK